MGKFERILSLLFGLFLVAGVASSIYIGHFEFTKYGTAIIDRTLEPAKFWGLLVAKGTIGLLAIYLSLPDLSRWFKRKDTTNPHRSLDSHKAEIEVLIAYGRSKHALKQIDALLMQHPGDKELLELKQRARSSA